MPLRPQKLVLISLMVSILALVGCAVAALTSQSFTIRADLLNAFLELSGDIVVLVAIRMASNGRWAALDYGPGKIENFGALLVGMVMFLGLAGLGLQLAHAFYNHCTRQWGWHPYRAVRCHGILPSRRLDLVAGSARKSS